MVYFHNLPLIVVIIVHSSKIISIPKS